MAGYFNPNLDHQAIADELDRRGRVLVRDFFAPHVAQALHDAVQVADWQLAFRDTQGDAVRTGEQLRQMTPEQRDALSEDIRRVAVQGYQFSFFSHPIVHTAQRGHSDLLSRFVRWMADEEFLGVMRRLSRVPEIDRLYAQATLYRPGSFLRMHDDSSRVENRRIAYVINLTRDWRADWGGLLHFCDERMDVVDTFVPHFNSISLFRVPQPHFVSAVAPFANGERTAITGWLISPPQTSA